MQHREDSPWYPTMRLFTKILTAAHSSIQRVVVELNREK